MWESKVIHFFYVDVMESINGVAALTIFVFSLGIIQVNNNLLYNLLRCGPPAAL